MALSLLAACELVVGADFDDKTLLGPSASSSTGGSDGLPLGAPCTSAEACESGHCADGFCCDSACEGECADCAQTAGTCQLLAATTSCTDGSCDGAGTCATGATRWAKRFGDADFEEATACAFTASGALLVAGRFAGSIDFDGETLTQRSSGSGYSIFIVKFDAAGTHQWSLAFGTEGDVDVTGMAIDASGGPAIIGSYDGVIDVGGAQLTSTGVRAGYVIKLDAGGAYAWHAGFTGTGLFSRNGSQPDESDLLLQHIALGQEGEAYVAGAYTGSVNLGSSQLTPGGTAGAYVARIDAGGTVRWARSSSSDPNGLVAPRAIGARPGGGAFVAGHFEWTDIWFEQLPTLIWSNYTGSGGHDAFLVAYDGDGNALWARDPGGDPATQAIESLAVDENGNVLVSGTFAGALDFGDGNLFHPSGARGFVTSSDVFLAKLTADAGFVWDRSYGAFLSQYLLDTLVAGGAHVVVAGRHRGPIVNFGFGGLASQDNGWFVTKLTADQEPLWARALGTAPPEAASPDAHRLWDLAMDPESGAVAFCGRVVPTVDYGTGALPENGILPDAVVAVLEP